jgi:hypothetical protein
MEIKSVRTIDEVVNLDIQNCYVRHVSFDENGTPSEKLKQALGIFLIGKPVIAGFMGISEKTLKRWFDKYPDLPITRGGHRCYALSDKILWWIQEKQLDKVRYKRGKQWNKTKKASLNLEHEKYIALGLLLKIF